MLIRFFGSSFLFQYIALVIIASLLWLPSFLQPQPMPVGIPTLTPFYNIIFRLMSLVPALVVPLAFILLLLQSFMINSILAFHEFIPKNSLVAAFIYMILMSSVPGGLTLYPAFFSIFLLIFIIHWLFRMSDEEENLVDALSIPLFVTLASFFYFPAIFLMIFIWMSYIAFRIFKWREWLISLIGFFLPFIYLFTGYLYTEQSLEFADGLIEYFQGLIPDKLVAGPWHLAILGVVVFLILLPAIMRILPTLSSFNINIRKKYAATAWLVPLTAVMALSGGVIALNILYVLPATLLISAYYSLKRKSWFDEIILLVVLLLIFMQHFFSR